MVSDPKLKLEQKYPELPAVAAEDDPRLMVLVINWGSLRSCAWYEAHVSLAGSESTVVMAKLLEACNQYKRSTKH